MDITKRRPAETATAAGGSVVAGIELAAGPWWCAVLTALVAWAPSAFTWLVANGGLKSVWRKVVG
jgi:hypothetical protein